MLNIRRVRSLRCYRFIRVVDGKLLVKGETDWVIVDAKTRVTRLLPEEMIKVFPLQQEDSGRNRFLLRKRVLVSALHYSNKNFALTRISLDELPTNSSNSPGSATQACLCGS